MRVLGAVSCVGVVDVVIEEMLSTLRVMVGVYSRKEYTDPINVEAMMAETLARLMVPAPGAVLRYHPKALRVHGTVNM